MSPQATEDRGVRSLLNLFRPILRASPSSFLRKEPLLPKAAALPVGSENQTTALAGVGNAPLSSPAAVLPPEGEVCSPLPLVQT